MTTKSCDYEFLLPTQSPLPAAPVPPDAEAAALLSNAARAERPRRFAFVQLIEQEDEPRRAGVLVHGVQHPDGTVLLWGRGGHPFGWYTSIDSAHTRMPFASMCLVWLDSPRDPDTIAAADAERDAGRVSTWVVTAPFLAYGAADARLRAIDILDVTSAAVPGLAREYAIIADTRSTGAPLSLFCEAEACDKPPYHDGPHTTPTPTADAEPDAPEPDPGPAQPAPTDAGAEPSTEPDPPADTLAKPTTTPKTKTAKATKTARTAKTAKPRKYVVPKPATTDDDGQAGA